MKKRSATILLFFIALLLCATYIYVNFLYTPLVSLNKPAVNFVYHPGEPLKKLAYELKGMGALKQPLFFVTLARFKDYEHILKAGEYLIEPGMKPLQLLDKMRKGEAINHAFTIVEGRTFKQTLAALANNPYVVHALADLTADQVMQKLGLDGSNPEGRFAPETFVFSGYVTDVDILHTALNLMQKWLHDAWERRDANLPYHCEYDALIVASIIEKETAVEAEKPNIAGVIVRRLAANMRLQLDPTVIYGLGDIVVDGKLTETNLKTDTAYNTYMRKGLPPTPIAMPSKNSIYAAMHPTAGTAMYFVAKGDGTHEFSDTLIKQDQAIKKYLLSGNKHTQ